MIPRLMEKSKMGWILRKRIRTDITLIFFKRGQLRPSRAGTKRATKPRQTSLMLTQLSGPWARQCVKQSEMQGRLPQICMQTSQVQHNYYCTPCESNYGASQPADRGSNRDTHMVLGLDLNCLMQSHYICLYAGFTIHLQCQKKIHGYLRAVCIQQNLSRNSIRQ